MRNIHNAAIKTRCSFRTNDKKIQITYRRLKDIKVVMDTSKKYLRLLIETKSDL